MRLEEFYFDLPENLIAQTPLEDRETSRLLYMDRQTGSISHHTFVDIIEYLSEGDCLVLNDTRVIPARLLGTKESSGARIEFVLLKRIHDKTWEIIVKPGKKARPGSRFVFGEGLLKAEIQEIVDGGNRLVRFEYEGIFEQILERIGITPLPPYITHSLEDRERYQTVYAKHEGSAAAPTAGLHFTNKLLQLIQSRGVQLAYVTLHIGLGTFRPVKVDKITDHKMHSEYYSLSEGSAEIINRTKCNGKKVIAVGTTSCRVLESIADSQRKLVAKSGETDIFIYPGYDFKIIDGLLTNFHLPESTLLMLVSAFAGQEHVMHAYQEAVKSKYRFFSFGDAMLLL